uniref:Ig-like domain-containing protein n=1 Tax=Ascaris lumbricoides TaxID=6252 RepID=A0A0M3IST9_ASCLU
MRRTSAKRKLVWLTIQDGRPALSLPLVQTLSEGQQFKIISANAQHRGSYMCTALNKVGKAEISFDVDVISL